MTEQQFKNLGIGDIVRHKTWSDDKSVIVTGNYGDRVTAVRTHDITNPFEWVLVRVSEYKSPHQPPPKQQHGS